MVNNEQSGSNEPSIFLCLSGGGFRATLFHYGCLKRLNELGILGYVYGISATSGGAITAALLLQNCSSHINKERNAYIYNWETFEKQLLNFVTRGALEQVNKLISAYTFYIFSLLFLFFFIFDYLSGIDSTDCWIAIGLLCLSFAIISLNWIFYCGSVVALAVLTLADYFPINTVYFGFSIIFFIVGLIYHFRLFWLIRKMSGKTSNTKKKSSNNTSKNRCRFIKMLFCPSFLRIETMNVSVFNCQTLDKIHSYPHIFLTAVNLCNGEEMVFTNSNNGALLSLGSRDCGFLWDGYGLGKENKYAHIELAQAVAASSAFPPVFLPVKIDDEHIFSDGGLVDNLAIKVPEAFSLYIDPWYSNSYGNNKTSFKDKTKFVLILDGSHILDREQSKTKLGSRLKALFRIFDIPINAHGEDAKIAALNFQYKEIPAWSMSLQQSGLEAGNFLVDNDLTYFLPRIRTHLDKFNLQECATLAYYGYSMVEEKLCTNHPFFGNLVLNNAPPPLDFKDILPKNMGDWNDNPKSLRKTLSDSYRRKFNIFSLK